MNSTELFFSLLRRATGNKDVIPATISAKEWDEVFELAKQQALVGIIFCAIEKLDPAQRPPRQMLLKWWSIAEQIKQRSQLLKETARQVEQCFAKRNPVAHPTVMMRRTMFEKAGCYYPMDFVRNEDTMLWYRAYMGGAKIANLSDVLLNFRMTDDMFTQRRNGKAFAKNQLDMRKMINRD